MNVLRNLTDLVAFWINLAAFWGIFQIKTQDFFFPKPIFFSRRNHFLNALRNLTISVASYNKFLSLAFFWKKSFVFSKNLYNLFIITNFRTFWEVLPFQSLFTASLLRSAIFCENSISFFKKPTIFFHRKT